MLLGWSSVAIFVSPGMSTSVRVGTLGERMVSIIGSLLTLFPLPSVRFVSASISSRTACRCDAR